METDAIFYDATGLKETQNNEWDSTWDRARYTCETKVVSKDVSPFLGSNYFHMMGGYTFQLSRVTSSYDENCSRKVAFLQAFDFAAWSSKWTFFFDEKYTQVS